MRGLRIGILTQWYDPEPGPAALPGALARGLAERGHRVEVLTGFPNYPDGELAAGYRIRPRQVEEHGGVRVTRVALYPSHDASAGRRVANYGSFAVSSSLLGVPAAFGSLDALWVNYSPVSLAVPLLAQRALRRTPSVVHVLDLWPDTLTASGFGSGRLGQAAIRGADAACRAMYRTAARVAYISPGVGDVLASRGVPRAKLRYAPMWADETVYYPRPRPHPRPFGLDDAAVVLAYAGTLGPAQGLDTLVRACAAVRDRRFVCLVAGSGIAEDHLRRLAGEVGADNVRFLGRLPAGEVTTLLAAADAAYVSLNDDPLAATTMPSKVQSTMASGLPLVGSLVGDAATVVTASRAGWVSPPSDVNGLTANLLAACDLGRDGLASLGENARGYYEREFGYSGGVDRIETMLREAVLEGRR